MATPNLLVNEPASVTLREITAQTVREVTALSVGAGQTQFVAANAESLAEALFKKEAWYRAIYAGDCLVGFVMLFDEALRSPPPTTPRVALWRLMIDERYQGRGYGRAALVLIIDFLRDSRQYSSLQVSYFSGEGCPEPFYRRLGFEHTGRVVDGEVIMELPLSAGD